MYRESDDVRAYDTYCELIHGDDVDPSVDIEIAAVRDGLVFAKRIRSERDHRACPVFQFATYDELGYVPAVGEVLSISVFDLPEEG